MERLSNTIRKWSYQVEVKNEESKNYSSIACYPFQKQQGWVNFISGNLVDGRKTEFSVSLDDAITFLENALEICREAKGNKE